MLKSLQDTHKKEQLEKLEDMSAIISSFINLMQAFHRIRIWQNKINTENQRPPQISEKDKLKKIFRKIAFKQINSKLYNQVNRNEIAGLNLAIY